MTARKSTRTTQADIKPTAQNKGLTLTLTINVYDGGMITLDDEPMNRNGDQAQGYVAVMSATAEKLWMLQRESAQRQLGGQA